MEGIEMITSFGQLWTDFNSGYEFANFVGFEMSKLRNDLIPDDLANKHTASSCFAFRIISDQNSVYFYT